MKTCHNLDLESSESGAARQANDPREPGRADPKSIAVLAFSNMSSDPEHEYLSDGITEDLIAALSQVEGLRVLARTSSFAFKGKNEDVRRIGEQLHVAVVLEGSVRKIGSTLRITAQLISVASGYHLWSDQFDCAIQDIFSIQDEITRSIVDALKVRLGVNLGAPLAQRQTNNTEAYQLYLKGRYCWTRRGHGLKKGSLYFELALLEDPNYALAYSGLADTYNLLGFYGHVSPTEAASKARSAALKALEVGPGLAEAHASLGFARFIYDWDWGGAEKDFQAALQLNGRYLPARNWYARLLSAVGKHEAAVAEDRRAIEIDPISSYTHMHLGWLLVSARRYDEAIVPLKRALEINPKGLRARCLLGQAYLFRGFVAEAISELESACAASEQNAWALATLGYAQALTDRRLEAETVLRRLSQRAKDEYIRPSLIALVHAGLGNIDHGLKVLENARAERDCWLPLVNSDPSFDPVRSDSRFAQLLDQLGLDPKRMVPSQAPARHQIRPG